VRGDECADHRPRRGNLGKLEDDDAGVPDHAGADLDRLALQTGRRPARHGLRQADPAEEDGEAAGRGVAPEPHLVVPEAAAGDGSAPLDGALCGAGENARPRRELQRAQIERDILKKPAFIVGAANR